VEPCIKRLYSRAERLFPPQASPEDHSFDPSSSSEIFEFRRYAVLGDWFDIVLREKEKLKKWFKHLGLSLRLFMPSFLLNDAE
jgi:hypothetical protein